MASAVILQVEKDAAAKIEPLLTTTDQTQRIPIEQLEQKPPKIKEIAQNFEPYGKVMMLGARISGVVKSTFPDGPPQEEETAEDATEDEEVGRASCRERGCQSVYVSVGHASLKQKTRKK